MSRLDADILLRRALERAGDLASLTLAITHAGMTRWASATFAGARHELVLDGEDDAGFAAWLAALPEAELSVRGHLVADLRVVRDARGAGRRRVIVEVLTVEER